MAVSSGQRWGDDDDSSVSSSEQALVHESSSKKVRQSHSSRADPKTGIRTVTSYKPHPSQGSSQLIQTVTKVRTTKEKLKVHRDVFERLKWSKFGEAATNEDQSNVTIASRDDVFMEDPNADEDLQEEDVGKALAGNLNAFWAKQQRRNLERKYEVDGDDAAAANSPDGWTKVGEKDSSKASSATAKYVPPSMRGSQSNAGKSLADREHARASAGPNADNNRDQNTIRVTNISEDTTEADLQDLFQGFGRISRVYLAKDKETMQSRGFAFVSFVHREDAARAMDKLQGFGYDHLILKLEWARPSAPRDPGSEGTQFRSGYGKALAQDTKEKVSYASNLTRGHMR